ncbi:proteinaceous RNase P 1, chloroplastic/mitochondrial-like isoform X4 [Panicum hallii]|uniref:proteinaceous RNase P 1, chloroplastic/mitochondrial-like isoform X4 n=1 Tax=Panicum hallii TaxID=206008 RepID=UPI000DF4E6E7|nr:proteinaceous RNase P 1, chloroplastic/mitochondrial-like isoform X4 [Panicum hallii]
MASLFATRSLPAHHRHLLFPASSSPPIGSRRSLVPPPPCRARELLDVMPQRDDGRSPIPRTEEGRAGSAGVRHGSNGGTVRGDTTTWEAGPPVQREGSRGVPRPWKKGDRVVIEERRDWVSQEKNRRRGPMRTGEQEWRRDAKRWTRGGNGMWAKESGNAGNSRDVGSGRRNVTKKKKRSKGSELGGKLRVELDMCSKRGDVMGAISLYDSAVKDGIRLGQHHYNVLLYLCSSAALGFVQPAKSGNTGSGITSIGPAQKLDSSPNRSLGGSEEEDASEGHVQDQEKDKADLLPSDDLNVQTVVIPVGDELREYARTRGFEIFEKMCEEKERIQMSEAALTAKARMALSTGDGDMAFEIVKQMKDLGITPKLRSYGPALTAYCNSGNVEKAFEVEAHMLESGITPEEAELEMLLRVSVVGRRGDKVYYLLHKFRAAVRQVSPSAAQLFEAWFSSPTASKVGKRKWDAGAIAKASENNGGGWHGFGWLGRGKWIVTRSNINKNGVCLACGEKLTIIDLDPKETEDFATFVEKLAIKRERNLNFKKFQRWLEKHGPFEAVVDAANVGLFSHKHLSLSKVNAVADAIRQRFTSRKWPLVVLHNRHLTGERMKKPGNHKLVEKWKQANSIYATPNGSNDDWYWLYTAIRCKCLIITNDEMRDHTFQILEKDFFPKWKERHQVRFSYEDSSVTFQMPPPYSVVIQGKDC